jgi:hypothetical protein
MNLKVPNRVSIDEEHVLSLEWDSPKGDKVTLNVSSEELETIHATRENIRTGWKDHAIPLLLKSLNDEDLAVIVDTPQSLRSPKK